MGGIFATLGVVFPSLVIVSIIAAFISNFAEISYVQHALAGIRVCVCVLIFNSVLKLSKGALVDKWSIFIFAAVLILSLFFNISAAYLVLGAGFAGYVIKRLVGKEKNNV